MIKNIFLSLILASFSLAAAQAAEFDLGMKMRTLDDQAGSLKDHVGKGKWTLVMIWETTCSICKQQEPEYVQFHNQHKDTDAEVVSVAIDGSDKVGLIKQYAKDNSLPFTVMVTDKVEIREKFLAATDEPFRGTPTYLLFNPEGELSAAQPGALPATSVEKFIAAKSAQ